MMGAMRVQTYRETQTHPETIFTHIADELAETVPKSAAGLWIYKKKSTIRIDN